MVASNSAAKKGGGKDGGDGAGQGTSAGAICERAASSGNLQDRFDCALATDPSIPKFIKDERFQQEFENITGHPLAEVINGDVDTIRTTIVPETLDRAYDKVKGTQSTLQFIGKVADLGKSILANVDDEDYRSYFLGNLPAVLADAFSDVPGRREAATAVAANAPAGEANPSALGGTALRAPASASAAGPQLAAAKTSIFDQVSRRYRLTLDRVEQLGWALRYNQ